VPLFVRKEDKKDVLLHLEERQERLKKRFDTIHTDGETIHRLVKVCCLVQCDSKCCGKVASGVVTSAGIR